MNKNRNSELRVKSLQKKNNKDFYFPAIELKTNVAFPFRKSLKFKSSDKHPENSKIQQIRPETFEDNPEAHTSNQMNHEQTASASMLKDLVKKQKNQQMHRKSSSTSKDLLNKSAIYFTKRQLELFGQKSIEIEEKKSKLGQKFMQRKQSFESFKKMKQMLREQEKRALYEDIEFKRQQRQREQRIKEKQIEGQNVFLHEENLVKIDMERCLKFRNKHEEINLTKQKYIETEDNSHFLKMEDFKSKKIHMNLLQSRLVFLLNDKIKNAQNDEFLDERMTSRSIFRENGNDKSRSKELSSGK